MIVQVVGTLVAKELDRVELMLDNLYRELLENQKKGSLI